MLEVQPMNAVDIGALIIMIFGCLIGLALGLVRAGLFIVAWLGAGLATYYGLPIMKIYTQQFIDDKFSADLTTGVGIFLVTLVCLFLLSSLIGSWVRHSRLNALDRSLGMVAGLATSSFFLAGAFLIMENIWPGNQQPKIMQEAKSLPIIRLSARHLNDVLPKKLKNLGAETFYDATNQSKKAVEKGIYDRLVRPETKNSENEDRIGYEKKERNNLKSAIDRLNQSSP